MSIRFACEEDAATIAEFVNVFYAVEQLEDSPSEEENPRGFRAMGPRTSQAFIEHDMSTENLNWVLIENIDDEDDTILACARLDVVGKAVVVNTFAYSLEGRDSDQKSLRQLLLRHLEASTQSLGIEEVIFEVSQYDAELLSFLESCGYQDFSGRSFTEKELETLKPVKTCLLICLKKIVRKARDPSGISSDDGKSDDEVIQSVENLSFETGIYPLNLEDIMSDLFSAMHREIKDT